MLDQIENFLTLFFSFGEKEKEEDCWESSNFSTSSALIFFPRTSTAIVVEIRAQNISWFSVLTKVLPVQYPMIEILIMDA